MLDRNDIEMGSTSNEDNPNNTYTQNESGSRRTLINIDDFIPSYIEDENSTLDHNRSTGTLIDIDAVVEAYMKNIVVIDDDDDDDGKNDKIEKTVIDTDDDDIKVPNAKSDGTNSTENTDNTSIESTNRNERRQDANDSPHNVVPDVLEVHVLAQDVEENEEDEPTCEYWCDCGMLCWKTWRTIRGLCRNKGSLKSRLYRWIVAIAVFVIASGGIGAVVARIKNTSQTVVDTVKGGVPSVYDSPTEAPIIGSTTEDIGKTSFCPCENLYDNYGNPYGTFNGTGVGTNGNYSIVIYYNETGIYEEFPSLFCPVVKGTIDSIESGSIRYLPATELVKDNCVPGGMTHLEQIGTTNKFIYEFTYDTTTTTEYGEVIFECEMTC